MQGYYRLALKCARCPNLAWVFIVVFAIALCGVLVLGVWLNSRRVNLAALGIGVDFAQVRCSSWLLCGVHCCFML